MSSQSQKLESLIVNEISKIEKTIELTTKERTPYELQKIITLHELADDTYDMETLAPSVAKLEILLIASKKLDFANRTIESISEKHFANEKYNYLMAGCLGIKNACETVNELVDKAFG